jgi:MFS family permease
MDTSSELVHALLPAFMTGPLGAGALAVGLVEGIAEATAAVVKPFSGALSDRLRRRKPLVLLGYGLAALSKPLFPLAASVATVLGARFIDRVGKGIRGTPRDALIADVTPKELRGSAYGLRQSLDTVGAVLGPLAAILLMLALSNDLRAVLWFAVVPAAAAVLLLFLAVREPARATAPLPSGARSPLSLATLPELGGRFWGVVALGAVLTLARFSEAFLILRAQDIGLSLAFLPTVMIVMNVVYAAGAYPAGLLADRGGRTALLVSGLSALIAADVVLGAARSQGALFAGVGLWGLHMALTQGLLSKLVADAAPESLRGTAFGVFHLVSGVALLAASLIAGALWSAFGPAATFHAGALFTTIALLGLVAVTRRRGVRSASFLN